MKAPKILKINNISEYKIETSWTNGDVRLIDFTEKLELFSKIDRYKDLVNHEKFAKVEVGEGDTLCWPNIRFPNSKGVLSPLAFDPDVLFSESKKLKPKTNY